MSAFGIPYTIRWLCIVSTRIIEEMCLAGACTGVWGNVFVDAHAHLDQYADEVVDDILLDLERREILTLSPSMDPESFARTQAIARRSPYVIPGFGLHPWKAHELSGLLPELEGLFAAAPFIGEIGLDYRWVEDPSTYPSQRLVYEFQLEVARDHGKMVNIHTAGAERDALEIAKASGIERVIVHWYSGPLDVLDEMIEQGFMFTVGVELLSSSSIRDIALRIPGDQLLTETDNPGGWEWLTGEIGRPSILEKVVATLAELKGLDPSALSDLLVANLWRTVGEDPGYGQWTSLIGGGREIGR